MAELMVLAKKIIPESKPPRETRDRKSTRLNSSHLVISYAVFCLKKKKKCLKASLPVPCYSLCCCEDNERRRDKRNDLHSSHGAYSVQSFMQGWGCGREYDVLPSR